MQEGRVRRRLGFTKNEWERRGESPLVIIFLALYRQVEIYKQSLSEGEFYMLL
jgi:hypothetical protein